MTDKPLKDDAYGRLALADLIHDQLKFEDDYTPALEAKVLRTTLLRQNNIIIHQNERIIELLERLQPQ